MAKTYFTYKAKVDNDWIHYTTPLDVNLESLTWISTKIIFVAQIEMEKLCYLEYEAENEVIIRWSINNETIKTDYQVIEKTVEEAKTFIDICFWDNLISSSINWDTVEFELIPPEY